MAAAAVLDQVHRIISTAVDAGFYRAVHPDLDRTGLDPVAHYADMGWREGRDPAPWFSTEAYLALNDDVARAGVNPLFHFLTQGRREGREIRGSGRAAAYLADSARRGHDPVWGHETGPAPRSAVGSPAVRPVAVSQAVSAEDRALVAAEFDRDFYLTAYPDVGEARIDPLEHFLSSGWREGRDPSNAFSFRDYLEANPDVAASGMNSFLHYLRTGRAEGRTGRNNLGFRYEVIAHLRPVEDRVAEMEEAAAKVTVTPDAVLAQALAVSRTGLADLHLTFSHDDYQANVGGLQLCLQREGAAIAALGRDHLHVFPAVPSPVVRPSGEPGPVRVLFNGRSVGAFMPATVANVLAKAAAAAPAGNRSFAIHSLLGHAAAETVAIIQASGLSAGYFWLHDFASVCAGFHLIRNDVADCGAPPPDSPACGVCIYQPYRARHLTEHGRLFEALDLTVAAPSQPTLDTWLAGWNFPARATVIQPLARLVERKGRKTAASGPFRFAFLGTPTSHKGWPIFRDLAIKHADDPRFVFMHLATNGVRGVPAEHHPVSVSADDPLAMQAAVERLNIDAAMVWSLCRETFSFTAHEAAAAGAAILTSGDSGNVAAFVRAGGHGLVLPDEHALAALFETGEVLELARAVRKPATFDLAFSALTVDLLEQRP